MLLSSLLLTLCDFFEDQTIRLIFVELLFGAISVPMEIFVDSMERVCQA